ncbi:MAG TPA: DNA repair protein RecO [Rhizobiales bacterium]|nr:DNA repair protein RecO [Hyphomicrobiales bacterium]
MQWSDEGIVLSSRVHGETSAIVELLTASHGRHLGLVRGGRSKRLRPVLQTGNLVSADWRARLSEHLGSYVIELLEARAAPVLDDRRALAGLNSLAALARLLPEREPHSRLFKASNLVIEALGEGDHWPALLARWEMGLLDELGFGLDLGSCAGTGATANLDYVSPRSGRAVSREAGEPYKDKLFPLPAFLLPDNGQGSAPSPSDVAHGFRLTGYFLNKNVWGPRDLQPPAARERLIALLEK